MKFGLFPLLLAAVAYPAFASPVEKGWQLVWSDEFDGTEIDRQKWGFEKDCWGGGNDERQCYTDRNARVENGHLIISARKEDARGPVFPEAQRKSGDEKSPEVTRNFTSARLTTKGKGAWQYGRVEVRAKLPSGQGTWPAIWMLPEEDVYGPWAASGEIDILEAVNLGTPCAICDGGVENRILGTLHFGGTWPHNLHKGVEVSMPEVLDGFHVFGIEWQPGQIIWTFDGRQYGRQIAADWSTTGSRDGNAPFDRPFHLIINLAIGGRLAEGRGQGGVSEEGFPKEMEIDWVRIWQGGDRQ